MLKCFERKASKKLGVSAQKFLNDLNADIEPGWTAYGQTNHILGKIAVREYVFHHALYGGTPLKGLELQWRILQVAMNLPGYEQWCRHHYDIQHLVVDWSRAIELSSYYPYGGDAVVEREPEQSAPTWNEQQAIAARERIRSAVVKLLEAGTMPTGARNRNEALRQFGISSQTLYKNKDLWHPEYGEKTLTALPDGVIHPVGKDRGEVRSPKAAPAGAIHSITAISLSSLYFFRVGSNKSLAMSRSIRFALNAAAFRFTEVSGRLRDKK